MKKSILTLLILGGGFMLLPDTASAQAARHYAWCAHYAGGFSGGGTNCYFRTRSQCLATVSGVGGYCAPNPFYEGTRYRERPRKYRRVYREY